MKSRGRAKQRVFRVSAYALVRRRRRILLCRVSKVLPQWEGYWTLPGGGLEFGESPEQALVREVEEETGFRVVPRSVAAVDSHHDDSTAIDFHGIHIVYHADLVGGELAHEVDGSTDRCEWHPLPLPRELPVVGLVRLGLRLIVASSTKRPRIRRKRK